MAEERAPTISFMLSLLSAELLTINTMRDGMQHDDARVMFLPNLMRTMAMSTGIALHVPAEHHASFHALSVALGDLAERRDDAAWKKVSDAWTVALACFPDAAMQ